MNRPNAAELANLEFVEVIQLINQARAQADHAVNTTLIDLYWRIGQYVNQKIETDTWGKGTVTALSKYIQLHQPGIRGFSP